MPKMLIELAPAQLEEVEAYAQRRQLSVAEVLVRALDHFLALARVESDEIDLPRDMDTSPAAGFLDRDL